MRLQSGTLDCGSLEDPRFPPTRMASSRPTNCPVCGTLLPTEEMARAQLLSCPGCHTVIDLHALSFGDAPSTLGFDQPTINPYPVPFDPHAPEEPEVPLDPGHTRDYAITNDGTVNLGAGRVPEEAPRRERVGRFRIESTLGNGAFGTVYRAFDPLLDREVALKVPRFVADGAAVQARFVREAKSAARLRHPNIVAVYESGQSGEVPFIASEFVDGVTLSNLLRDGPLPLRTAVEWARQIADALNYAHGEGIIHRDIKPANIMMNRAGRPQVMDFGLARRVADEASHMTLEGQVLGTPAYMAPEQARGQQSEVGPHSDQYSLGAVLYEMLCGQTPFTGDAWTMMSRVGNVHDAPPSPRQLRPELPRDLESCCLKALEKDRASRYANMGAFADDLGRWLDGRTLLARPINPVERFGRWCRKNRTIAGLLGLLLGLLVMIAVVGFALAFQFEQLANTARKDAEDATEAREKETLARRATERLLIDTYTETGLSADRAGNAREAVLWFANAAARAESHPDRERQNRVRVHSWLSEIAVPVYAFEPPGEWTSALRYHPSGRYLLSTATGVGAGGMLRDLRDGSIVPFPTKEPVDLAMWSPDGRWLAINCNREVAIGTFPEGKEVDRWTCESRASCLCFSGDGKRLAVGSRRCVRIRDLAKCAFVAEPIALESTVKSVVLNADGSKVAVHCEDNTVRVVNASDGSAAIPPQPSHSESKDLVPVFLAPNRLAIMDGGQSLRCWDLAKRELVWERTPWQRSLALRASPDGKYLAAAEGFEAVILDADTGRTVGKRVVHRNHINDLSFSPDGTKLLSASSDQTARISHVPSGEPVVAVVPHNDLVHRSVWSPDGNTFATVHWKSPLVRVWKLGRDSKRDYAVPMPMRNSFIKVCDDGRHFVPSGLDTIRDRQSVQVHDVRTGAPVGKQVEWPGFISDVSFVPGTTRLAVAGSANRDEPQTDLRRLDLERAGRVQLLDFTSGADAFPSLPTPSEPIAVECSPDGRTLVVLCQRGQVLLVDAATGRLRKTETAFQGEAAHHGYVIRDRIRFAPNGDRFAIWGCGENAEMRSTETGALLFKVKHDHLFVHDLRFSPNGDRFVTCSSDTKVKQWTTATGDSAGRDLVHSGWVFTARFSGDGKRLLTASSDRQARIWDLESGQTILATLAQSDEIFAVGFAPNEETFLLATRDGRIGAWDAKLGNLVAPVRVVPDMVYDLAMLGNGSHVLAAGRLKALQAFALDGWIRPPDPRLSRDDLQLLGEIVSSQRIHEGGAATGLSRTQWLERWNEFHKRHPNHPVFRFPFTPP